jgi:hypothetical protein
MLGATLKNYIFISFLIYRNIDFGKKKLPTAVSLINLPSNINIPILNFFASQRLKNNDDRRIIECARNIWSVWQASNLPQKTTLALLFFLKMFF